MGIPIGGISTIRSKPDMKLLIINGSPRVKGNISGMLAALEEEAKARGIETVLVSVADLHVMPCRGCMSCRNMGKCVLPEDDAQRVLQLIRECDVLAVGAPCYWGNMPGQLKMLFDRMVYGMVGESQGGIPKPLHKGKKSIIISTCTTPFPFNILFNQSRGTVRALKEILKWSGFRNIAVVQQGGTKKHPLDGKKIEACRKAVRKL